MEGERLPCINNLESVRMHELSESQTALPVPDSLTSVRPILWFVHLCVSSEPVDLLKNLEQTQLKTVQISQSKIILQALLIKLMDRNWGFFSGTI